MNRFSSLAAGCIACLAIAAGGHALAASTVKVGSRTGVLVTPKNFPKHNADDVTEMFRIDAELGSFAVMRIEWSDENRLDAMRAMVTLARQANLAPVVEFNPMKADELKGAAIQPPKDVAGAAGRRVSFSNPAVAEPFMRAALAFAELKPPYLAVATDVNLLALSDPGEYAAFAEVYSRLYPRIKEISPETKVFVTFQWDALQRLDRAAARQLVDAFRPRLDVLALTSDPRKLFEKQGPTGIPQDYFARAAAYGGTGREIFLETGWPSDGGNGEADQVSFIRQLPFLTESLKPSMLAWTFLHDVKILIFTLRAGLITAEGKQKPAFAAFKEISDDRAPAVAAPSALPARMAKGRTAVANQQPAHFAVYTARLDGSDFKVLISSPNQEMTHPRVSPDGKRIVLTRYNNRGKDGKASEEQGYENTEIMVMNLDGTGLETIIPPQAGIIAANGCWTPDGKGLIWLSTDNPSRAPEIRQIDLATRAVSRVPTPPGMKTTDPHWEAGKVVFPVKADGKGADALWLMDADGKNARQVTRPKRTGILPGLFGDFDPKLSPDGTKVAFMRIDGGEGWRVLVLDLATGEEREYTPKGVIEWLPTWSSDGKRLLYVHIDRSNPKEIGLYTMTLDGKDRRMVPLPRGHLYGHSSFFPSDGSTDKARIIFNGTEKPGL